MNTKHRLTGRTAVAVWPERLGEVREEPTDANLQRLCVLLDAIDTWVVQRWDKAGHDERMATLVGCRHQAREANRLVSEAQRTPSPAQRAVLARARAAREARPTDAQGLPGDPRVDTAGSDASVAETLVPAP
jgi:hypothetical protein